jgi:hypothetical protein
MVLERLIFDDLGGRLLSLFGTIARTEHRQLEAARFAEPF